MFRFPLIRHTASFAALALATALVSRAPANSVEYELTSLPNPTSVVYADNLNPTLTDTLSGTITISSSQNIFGTWNSTNLPTAPITLTYDLSESNSSVAITNIVGSQDLATLISRNDIQGGGLTLTSSGIFIPNPNVSGGQVLLEDDAPPFPDSSPYPLVQLEWNGNAFAWATQSSYAGASIEILAGVGTVPPVSSLYGNGATWQIAAAVPEPSTIVLGIAALAGLGLVSVRKKLRRD